MTHCHEWSLSTLPKSPRCEGQRDNLQIFVVGSLVYDSKSTTWAMITLLFLFFSINLLYTCLCDITIWIWKHVPIPKIRGLSYIEITVLMIQIILQIECFVSRQSPVVNILQLVIWSELKPSDVIKVITGYYLPWLIAIIF